MQESEEDAMADSTDVFEIMRTTRSMRRLKPDPVPEPLIRQILEAGVYAANRENSQRCPAKGWSMTDPNSPHAGGPPDRRSFGQSQPMPRRA